jgi:hypothetical protein
METKLAFIRDLCCKLPLDGRCWQVLLFWLSQSQKALQKAESNSIKMATCRQCVHVNDLLKNERAEVIANECTEYNDRNENGKIDFDDCLDESFQNSVLVQAICAGLAFAVGSIVAGLKFCLCYSTEPFPCLASARGGGALMELGTMELPISSLPPRGRGFSTGAPPSVLERRMDSMVTAADSRAGGGFSLSMGGGLDASLVPTAGFSV